MHQHGVIRTGLLWHLNGCVTSEWGVSWQVANVIVLFFPRQIVNFIIYSINVSSILYRLPTCYIYNGDKKGEHL